MANFFDEERYICDRCNTQVFEEFNSLILTKDKNNCYEKQLYKTMYRCVGCGKVHELKVRN